MSKYNFVHLHNHTEYSLLDGMLKIKNMVAKAKSLGMSALAMTDHGNLFGAIEFYKECESAKIKPIIGSEFYVTKGSRFDKDKDRYHLILLAKNNTGYKNLIKLSSLSFTEGFYYKPRIDRELIEKYSEGLICLSACIAGEIPSYILQGDVDSAVKKSLYYQELFGRENFFLELQYHGMKEESRVIKELYNISRSHKIPLVATNDAHYLEKADAEYQDILLCVGTKKTLSDGNRMKFFGSEFYLKTEEEMEALFKDVPSALKNTANIAEMCDLKLNLPGPLLPDFEIPSGYTKDSYLRELTFSGLESRYDAVTDEIKSRAEMELGVITRMGFPGYFLIVWDFIKYARDNGIWVGPGRGSGAGSIIAFALGITNIDPLKYDLLFERFLHEQRVSMPDFDIDFCKERRGEVIDYVNNKYTKEKVSQIVTFGKMKAKAVIRDVGRVLEIPLARVNQIAKFIPDEGKTFSDKIENTPELKEIFLHGTEEEKKLLDASIKLEGLNRQTGVHACGVVIGDQPIIDLVPVQIVKDEKEGDMITTQFPGPQLEECGLVKMDFLGLITLTLIRDCLDILKKQNIVIDIDKIPLDDKKVFELFSRGDADAIFQFESPGMKKNLAKLKPTTIFDLIAMNALYRPGPMAQIETYINRKHGREEIEYDHELVKPVLSETNGIMIYQEQVMKIAQILAGYDLGSADMLRRAMGKKKKEEMEKHKKIFIYGNLPEVEKLNAENETLKANGEKLKKVPMPIKGAITNGVPENVAITIFEKMEKFADYGFNKSHAAAYSYLAYQCAYLKAHYPVEYMAAVLTSEIGHPDKILIYVNYLHEKGIKILPPDINKSQIAFGVENGAVRFALCGIKGVGEAAAKNIIAVREKIGEFKSFKHYLKECDLRVNNKSVIDTLVRCGAMDSFRQKRKWLVENLESLIADAQHYQEDRRMGQGLLFGDVMDSQAESEEEGIDTEEWDDDFRLFVEKETLGFFLSGSPLDKHAKYIKANCNYDSKKLRFIKLDNFQSKVDVKICGIVEEVKNFKNENGDTWAKVILSDQYGTFDIIVYKNQFKLYGAHLSERKILFIKALCRKSKDFVQIIADTIQDLNEKKQAELSEFHIYVKDNILMAEDELTMLRDDFNILTGSLNIFFHLNDESGGEKIFKARGFKAPNDPELVPAFKEKYSFIEAIKFF